MIWRNSEKHFPIDTTTRDNMSPVWDMSQERVFMENLLNQRFNYFLVIFSIIIAGAINSNEQLHLQLILTLGAIVTSMLASVLKRSQEKLDLILTDLFTDPSHPAKIINDRAKERGSRRRLVGIGIPTVCCIVLILGSFCSWLNLLRVAPMADK